MDIKLPRKSPLESYSEVLLIMLFLVSSLYMYIEARSFHPSAGRWPQILSICVILGIILLLIQNYLPEPLRLIVADSGGMIDDEVSENATISEENVNKNKTDETPTVSRPIPDSLFTVLVSTAYIIAGYLFGILWVTPLFVASYTIWFRLKWHFVVFISIVSFGIAYSFLVFRNLAIDSGVLFGGF